MKMIQQKNIFPLLISLALITAIIPIISSANYGSSLCRQSGYYCYRAKNGDSWQKLFPNARQRDVVMRVNRTNMGIYRGMTIAIPNNLSSLDIMDVSPFPHRIEPPGVKTILISLRLHAFGAYDQYGYLVHWGPVSGGRGYCPDVGRRCGTPRGKFRITHKGGPDCVSSKFPIGIGGAPMYYCMFFYGGYAMHASYLPGYHASHGCVRLFHEDARWLNRNFTETGSTRVFIQSYLWPSKTGVFIVPTVATADSKSPKQVVI